MTGKIHKNFCPSCGVEKMSRKRDVGKLCNKCNVVKAGKYERNKKWASKTEYVRDLTERMKENFDWRVRKMYFSTKSRAKSKGLDFDLTLQDVYKMFPEDSLCPVLGIELAFGKGRLNTPSLDRFDNTKGYTKDNVYLISMRANILKSDATFEEIEALYHYMKYGV